MLTLYVLRRDGHLYECGRWVCSVGRISVGSPMALRSVQMSSVRLQFPLTSPSNADVPLRWRNTPYNGAFKRIMTYTYLISVPLLIAFSYGFAYIKYKEGWLDIGGISAYILILFSIFFSELREWLVLPKPYTFWLPKHRAAIFPLMLVFSFAWSLEMYVFNFSLLCTSPYLTNCAILVG